MFSRSSDHRNEGRTSSRDVRGHKSQGVGKGNGQPGERGARQKAGGLGEWEVMGARAGDRQGRSWVNCHPVPSVWVPTVGRVVVTAWWGTYSGTPNLNL